MHLKCGFTTQDALAEFTLVGFQRLFQFNVLHMLVKLTRIGLLDFHKPLDVVLVLFWLWQDGTADHTMVHARELEAQIVKLRQ